MNDLFATNNNLSSVSNENLSSLLYAKMKDGCKIAYKIYGIYNQSQVPLILIQVCEVILY